MAGRRPRPTTLKLVSGNPGKRAINKKEPKPKRVIPSCPDYLPQVSQVAWGRLSVVLDRMGVLTEADAAAMERMVDCYADIIECRKLIQRDGRTYKVTAQNGFDELIKANPAVAMLRAADAQFKAYLVEFGLTPAARSKVHASDDQEDEDPLAKYFG